MGAGPNSLPRPFSRLSDSIDDDPANSLFVGDAILDQLSVPLILAELKARRQFYDFPVAFLDAGIRSVPPFVSCQRGQRLLALPAATDEAGLSAHVEADPRDWLGRPGRDSLVVQTLSQRDGYAITLLAFDATETDADESDA
jgi:hypothetical protein